jgi:membrane AbrB-like protein
MSAALGQFTQILVAGLGGLVFHLAGVPAAWLSGAVVGVVIWGAFGFGRPMSRPLVDTAMLVSGATMGAAITPEAVAAMSRYPASLVLLCVGIAAITAASTFWLERVSRWSRLDSVLASVPGALSTVLLVASDRGAAVTAIAIVQAFRLLILIAVLPALVVSIGGGGADASMLIGEGMPVASPMGLAVTLAGGLAVGLILERLRVAAAILIGAAVVSTVLHAADLTPGVVPPVIATVGLVLVGVFIAERFRALDRRSLVKLLPPALASFAVTMLVAAVFAVAASWATGIGLAEALVAFAPGGLEAMMVLALVLGLDPLYVGVHHLVRFLGIGLILPFLVSWLKPEAPREPE